MFLIWEMFDFPKAQSNSQEVSNKFENKQTFFCTSFESQFRQYFRSKLLTVHLTGFCWQSFQQFFLLQRASQ